MSPSLKVIDSLYMTTHSPCLIPQSVLLKRYSISLILIALSRCINKYIQYILVYHFIYYANHVSRFKCAG